MRTNGTHGRNGHLARSVLAIGGARAEFERAKRSEDELDAGQAGEKAWLAVAEATNALLRIKGIAEHKWPHGHAGVYHLLRREGGEEMARVLLVVRAILHTEAFYRGDVDWKLVGDGISQAEGFVGRVKALAERTSSN